MAAKLGGVGTELGKNGQRGESEKEAKGMGQHHLTAIVQLTELEP